MMPLSVTLALAVPTRPVRPLMGALRARLLPARRPLLVVSVFCAPLVLLLATPEPPAAIRVLFAALLLMIPVWPVRPLDGPLRARLLQPAVSRLPNRWLLPGVSVFCAPLAVLPAAPGPPAAMRVPLLVAPSLAIMVRPVRPLGGVPLTGRPQPAALRHPDRWSPPAMSPVRAPPAVLPAAPNLLAAG